MSIFLYSYGVVVKNLGYTNGKVITLVSSDTTSNSYPNKFILRAT